MHCQTCQSALDLAPGEECGVCGSIALDSEDIGWRERHSSVLGAKKVEAKEIVRYYYQSQVEFGKDGVGLWKFCNTEESCMLMARNGFRVKKVVKRSKMKLLKSNNRWDEKNFDEIVEFLWKRHRAILRDMKKVDEGVEKGLEFPNGFEYPDYCGLH